MRLLTGNVQLAGPEKLDVLVRTLSGYDVIALQEVPYDTCCMLACKLRMHMYHCELTAVLTNKPAQSCITVPLGEFKKAAVCVTLEDNTVLLNVHLDHRSEDIRLAQMELIHPLLAKATVVTGDFNSLYSKDYTEHRWEEINTERELVGIERGRSDVIERLKEHRFSLSEFAPTTLWGTRVDYIAWKHTVTVADQTVLTTIQSGVSDHNMVVLSII